MTARTALLLIVASVHAGVLAVPATAAGQTSFSDRRFVLTGDSTRVDTVAGREILRMENGQADLHGVGFRDGTIDVDVKVTNRRSFVYVNFRIQSEGEQEEFYLRPHKSSLPDAAQYAPSFQRASAWQLYHGARGTASPVIEPNVWQRLRIVLSGPRAAFFLGDTTKPFLVIPHLAREPKAGTISLSSFVPAGTLPGTIAAQFSNLRIRDAIAFDFASAPAMAPLPTGVISSWDVGTPFAAPDTMLSAIAPQWVSRFTALPIEPDGFIELHRHVLMPEARRYVGVVAKFRVDAVTPGVRRFDLGFSDRATVFVNGKPVFSRDDSYDFAGRRDGLISFDQATAYLPLRAGANEIAVIVTDRFGGWGIMGRFPDMTGLRIR